MGLKNILKLPILRSFGGLIFVVLIVGVVAVLTVGTNTLDALGLPREVAGGIVTAIVILASLYGLYYFATEVIDW